MPLITFRVLILSSTGLNRELSVLNGKKEPNSSMDCRIEEIMGYPNTRNNVRNVLGVDLPMK